MTVTVTLPDGLHFVGASILSTFYLLMYQTAIVTKYRKLSGIKYPQVFADKSEQEKSKEALQFNCAQRAHQNTLEQLPAVYAATVLSAMKYPYFAASACLIWTFSRVGYTRGYVSGDPSRRAGVIYRIGLLAFLGQILVPTVVFGQWIFADVVGLISKRTY